MGRETQLNQRSHLYCPRFALFGVAKIIHRRKKVEKVGSVCRAPIDRHHLRRDSLSRAERRPRLHQLAALLEQIAALVGALNAVADRMGKRELGGFAREVRRLGGPIPEARAEAVRGDIQPRRSKQAQCVARSGRPCLAPGNTNSLCRTSAISLRMARRASTAARGVLAPSSCGRRGCPHALLRSISSQRAPSASPRASR